MLCYLLTPLKGNQKTKLATSEKSDAIAFMEKTNGRPLTISVDITVAGQAVINVMGKDFADEQRSLSTP